jgi:hypothetical protein
MGGKIRGSRPAQKRGPAPLILRAALLALLAAPAWAQAPQAANVAGEWDATYNTPGGPRSFTIVFQVRGDSLAGTVKRSDGTVPLAGAITGEVVTFRYTIAYNNEALTLTITARVTGDSMAGTVDFAGMGQEEFWARRAKAR